MTISAIEALNNWKNAIDNGDMAGLDNMLADDFIFENRAGDKDDKKTVLEWANDADFTCNATDQGRSLIYQVPVALIYTPQRIS